MLSCMHRKESFFGRQRYFMLSKFFVEQRTCVVWQRNQLSLLCASAAASEALATHLSFLRVHHVGKEITECDTCDTCFWLPCIDFFFANTDNFRYLCRIAGHVSFQI